MDFWFDDGVIEDFTKTLPFLKKIGACGIAAISTKKVGSEGFLGVKELLVMIEEGWKIASHGEDHKIMLKMDLAESARIFRDSKKWIIRNLGVEPYAFVAPWNILRLEQKKLAFKYYKLVRNPYTMHFHSKNFADVTGTITKYMRGGCDERGMIMRRRWHSSRNYLINKFNFYAERS